MFQSFVFGLVAAITIGLADLLAAGISRKIGIYRVMLATHVVSVAISTLYLPFALDFGGISFSDWAGLVALSVLIVATLAGLYKALQLGPVAVVSPIISAGSVVAIILAVLLAGERLSTGQVLSVAAIIGGVVMTSVDVRELRGGRSLIGAGALFALAAMVGGGIWFYGIGILSQEFGWFMPVYLNRLITLAILAPVQLKRSMWRWPGLGVSLVLGVTILGILETASLFSFARGAEVGVISIVAATFSVYPLVPVAGGLLIFREKLAPNQVVGLAVVIVGLVLLGAMTSDS